MLYAFFWVIPLHLNFICQCFETLWLFHLHRRVGMKILHTYPPMKIEQREYSKTLAYKIQTLQNYPKENIQHSEHSKSLKSSKLKTGPVWGLEVSFTLQGCKWTNAHCLLYTWKKQPLCN